MWNRSYPVRVEPDLLRALGIEGYAEVDAAPDPGGYIMARFRQCAQGPSKGLKWWSSLSSREREAVARFWSDIVTETPAGSLLLKVGKFALGHLGLLRPFAVGRLPPAWPQVRGEIANAGARALAVHIASRFAPPGSPTGEALERMIRNPPNGEGVPPGVQGAIDQLVETAKDILSTELDHLAGERALGRSLAEWLVDAPKVGGAVIDPTDLDRTLSRPTPSPRSVVTALFEGVVRAEETRQPLGQAETSTFYRVVGEDLAFTLAGVMDEAFDALGQHQGTEPNLDFLRVPNVALYSAARDAVSRGLPLDAYPPTGQSHAFEMSASNATPPSDLFADVMDALASLWLAAGSPPDGVDPTVDQILEMRGLSPHVSGDGTASGYKRAQREEVVTAALNLASLRLSVDGEAPLPLFEVDVVGAPPSASTRIHFNVGDAFPQTYETPLRHTTTLLPRRVLEMRPDRHFPKRLIRHVSTQWGAWGMAWDEGGALDPARLLDLYHPQLLPRRPDTALARTLSALHKDGILGEWKRSGASTDARILIRPPWAVYLSARDFGRLRTVIPTGPRE